MCNVEQSTALLDNCDSNSGVLKWVQNRYIYPELIKCNQILNILHFPLLWNIFERDCFSNYAGIGQVHNFVEDFLNIEHVNEIVLNSAWSFYHTRYIKFDNTPTNYFNENLFNESEQRYKETALNNLKNNNPQPKQKLEALLLIFFRLRNNVMHGNKNISTLYKQDELFRHANLLLMEMLNNYPPI